MSRRAVEKVVVGPGGEGPSRGMVGIRRGRICGEDYGDVYGPEQTQRGYQNVAS